MDTTTLTATVKPSTDCPDTEGAADAVITQSGKRIGKCTLIPDPYSGELSTWGSGIYMWASESLTKYLYSVDKDDRDDAILSIVSAVRDAARAMDDGE